MAYSAENPMFITTLLLMFTTATYADWSCNFETDTCGILFYSGSWERDEKADGNSSNNFAIQTNLTAAPQQASFTIKDDFNSSTGSLSFKVYELNLPLIFHELNTSLLVSTCADAALTSVGDLDQISFQTQPKQIPYSCSNSSQVEITFFANIWSANSKIRIDNIIITEDITTTPTTITTTPTPTTITNPSTVVPNPTANTTNTPMSSPPTSTAPTSQETTSSNSTQPSETITTTQDSDSNNTVPTLGPSTAYNETSTSDNTTSNTTSTTTTATTGTSAEETTIADPDEDSTTSGVTGPPGGSLIIPIVASVSACIVLLIIVFVVIFCNRKRFESKDPQAKSDKNDASADLYENPAYMDGRGKPGTSGSNGKATVVALSGNIFDQDKLEDNPMYWSQDNEPPQRDIRRNTSVTFKEGRSSPTKSSAGVGYERTIYTMGDQQYCSVDMVDVTPPMAPPKTPPRSPLKTLTKTPAKALQEPDDLDLYNNPLYGPQGESPSPGGHGATVSVGADVSLMYAKVDKGPSPRGKQTNSDLQDNPLYESQNEVPPRDLQDVSDPSLQDNPLYSPQGETYPGRPTADGTRSVGAGVSVKYGMVEPKNKRQSPPRGQRERHEHAQGIDLQDNPLYSSQDEKPVSGASGRLTNGASNTPMNYESIGEGTNDEQYTSIGGDDGLIASHLYEPSGDELRAVVNNGMYEDLR